MKIVFHVLRDVREFENILITSLKYYIECYENSNTNRYMQNIFDFSVAVTANQTWDPFSVVYVKEFFPVL